MPKKSSVPPQDQDLERIIEIAQLFYKKRLRQVKIAKKLEISQAEVSRCLKRAWDENIINFEVRTLSFDDIATEFKKRYPHLKDVEIANPQDEFFDSSKPQLNLGMKGALYFARHVNHGDTIGISCGDTLNAFIMGLQELRSNISLPGACKVYGMIMLAIKELVAVTPAALVANLVATLPTCRGYTFHLPRPDSKPIVPRSLRPFYEQHSQVSNLLMKLKDLDHYYVGVGSIDYSDRIYENGMHAYEFNTIIRDTKHEKHDLLHALQTLDAVGEISHQPYDQDGNVLPLDEKTRLKPLKEYFLGLDLEILKKHVEDDDAAQVVAIAGGSHKVNALQAALKAKLFNVFITDYETAQELLKLPPSVNKPKKKRKDSR